MTLTASNTNELLYDNNTVKTHHDNRGSSIRTLIRIGAFNDKKNKNQNVYFF